MKSFRETDDYEGINFFDVEEVISDSECDHIYSLESSGFRKTETYKCVKCGKLRYHTRHYD